MAPWAQFNCLIFTLVSTSKLISTCPRLAKNARSLARKRRPCSGTGTTLAGRTGVRPTYVPDVSASYVAMQQGEHDMHRPQQSDESQPARTASDMYIIA